MQVDAFPFNGPVFFTYIIGDCTASIVGEGAEALVDDRQEREALGVRVPRRVLQLVPDGLEVLGVAPPCQLEVAPLGE